MDNNLLNQISQGAPLKHADTVDKSVPQIDSDVKLKKHDRSGLLSEIAQPHELKHAETQDKSGPHIDCK